jgi:hypothetical protein
MDGIGSELKALVDLDPQGFGLQVSPTASVTRHNVLHVTLLTTQPGGFECRESEQCRALPCMEHRGPSFLRI